MTPTVLTLTEGCSRRPAGATAIAAGPPSSSLWAEIPGLTRPWAVRYSEPKTITSALLLGQLGQADAGAGVDDDVLGHVGRADRLRAAGEQLLGLLLLERFAEGVADVGERELGAGDRQQPAQGERVAVVVGVVVGNDDLESHSVPPFKWFSKSYGDGAPLLYQHNCYCLWMK